MSTAVASPAFVGRQHSLAVVGDALDQGPALVLIEGEPGIGKTRLLYEALATRADGGTLLATCPPLREPFALGSVVDGLRRGRARAPMPELSPLGGALRPLLPEWNDQLPPALPELEDPKQTRHRLFRALSELVERLAVEILVVEDAQWADQATLEWLLTLCASGDGPMSVVVTYRPHDVPDGSLLLRLTSRVPPQWTQARVDLGPLDVDEVRRMVGSMLNTEDVSEQFVQFLHQHADGIPLAVEETIRLMRDRHEIIRKDGAWTRRTLHELQVPPTVRDSVLERIDRLDRDTRQVLRAAATLAEPAEAEMIIAVAGLNERSGRRGIARGLAAGLLRAADGGGLEFRHLLDAKAVEDAAPVSIQWALHRRAAHCLQRLEPQPVVRLARHFREARDVEAWCGYAEASAAVAWQSGDDRTAVVTLLELLTTVEHPSERRARLAHKLGEAAFFAAAALGELAERVVMTLRDVLRAGDLPQWERGELRLQFGRMLWRAGHEVAAMEEFEAAVPDLDDRPDLQARAMANLAVPLRPDWPASHHLHWLDRATDLSQRAGSRLDRLAVAVNRATTLLLLGEEAGWRAIADIRESEPDPREQRLVALGLMNVAEASIAWGRYDDTRNQLDAAVDYIDRAHYERFVSTQRVVEAFLDWYRGTWAGLRESAANLSASDDTEPTYRLRARHILALLDLATGGRSAEHQLQELVDECTSRGVAEPEAALAPAALGRLRLVDGAGADVLAISGPVMDVITRKGVWLWAADIAPVHMDALVGAGRLADAEALVGRFAAELDGRNAPAPAAAVTLCRAIVAEGHGKYERAAGLFGSTASAWRAIPRPYDASLTLERQGRCLLAAGNHEQALAVLTDTEKDLRELGARWDADRVAHLLRQHGVEIVRTWRRGRRGFGDQLSPRELEVVALVARGMTNREVGEALFLSPKTVDRHLRSAMRKLGASSRTAVAVTASEAGLLKPEPVAFSRRS